MDYLVFGKTNWKENNNTTTEKTESISTGKCESCTNKDSLISQLKAHIDDLRMMIDNYKGLTGDLLNDKNELKESLNRELERNQELYNSLKGNK
jgi:predicted RNase H-like nuclease (RuvC/YqgF family)